jgi:hypothetical protein
MAQQPITFTTPQGIAQYPWLSKPDTKFSEEGDYKVNLILPKAEAIPLLKQINEVFAENVDKETKKAKGKDIKKASPPYFEELDDAGQPTGNVILKFKSKAAYKPAIFDAKGIPMIDSNIWGGSELKINGSIAPYYTSLIGAGVALRLRAVQVIQYVEGGSGSADRFGFEAVAGYEHKVPETFEEVVAEAPKALVQITEPAPAEEIPDQNSQVIDSEEPKVRAPSKPDVQPADDLSDIINQWAIK